MSSINLGERGMRHSKTYSEDFDLNIALEERDRRHTHYDKVSKRWFKFLQKIFLLIKSKMINFPLFKYTYLRLFFLKKFDNHWCINCIKL